MDIFRVLIIEDDMEGWAKPMKGQLQLLYPELICDIAVDVQTAKRYLARKRYHFISFDQHLPEQAGDQVTTLFGVQLVRQIKATHPLIGGYIYTAYGQKDNKILLGKGKYAFQYVDKHEVPAKQWAKKVGDWLQRNYWSFYFDSGQNVLPPPLVETAGFLHKTNAQDQAVQWIGYFIDFWEVVLRLSWAQTMGLARHLGQSIPVTQQGQSHAVIQILQESIPRLAQQGRLCCWNPYLGAQGEDQGWQGLKALDSLHQLRNDQVYVKTPEDWSGFIAQFSEHTLSLTDLAAFWADFPLISFNQNGSHNIIAGSAYPFAQSTDQLLMPDETTPEHVFVTWRDADDQPSLIDLWPYMKLRWHPALNRFTLCIVSHYQPQKPHNMWYETNLQNARKQPFKPDPTEESILLGQAE